MSTNIQDVIARLLGQPSSIFGGSQAQQNTMGPTWPTANDFGMSDPNVATPPEDFIASPNPSQPLPPEVRMEGYRRFLTNFTYGLGSGLTAATQNPVGRGLRTQAGMGAILQQPMVLQKAKEAMAQQKREEDMRKAQILAGILGQQQQQANQAKTQQLQQDQFDLAKTNTLADNARADKIDSENRAAQAEALKAKKAEEAAGIEVPGSRVTVLKDGKPTESWHVRITDPETGVVRTETKYGDQVYEKDAAAKSLQNDDYVLKNGQKATLSFDPTPTPQRPAGTYYDTSGKDVTEQVAGKYHVPPSTSGTATADSSSYKFHVAEVDKRAKPLDDAASRFSRLQDTISQGTAQADALVAPELLTVMAGGSGSGLRINEAEINRVQGGRPMIAQLQAKLRAWIGTDQKTAINFGADERKAIQDIMGIVGGKLKAKQDALTAASEVISREGATDQERKTALANLDKTLRAIDSGPTVAAPKKNPFK